MIRKRLLVFTYNKNDGEVMALRVRGNMEYLKTLNSECCACITSLPTATEYQIACHSLPFMGALAPKLFLKY